jgi:hypothetical protein
VARQTSVRRDSARRDSARGTGRRLSAVAAIALLAGSLLVATTAAASAKTAGRTSSAGRAAVRAVTQTSLGANVLVFDPSMPQDQIQTAVDAIAAEQLTNQFGTQRYALLFKPGTYGSAVDPLNFQVGYYTEVAGLGQNPDDVVINGSINVYNQCDANNSCIALNNFWRSLSNLSINVTNPPDAGCYAGEFWAVSQAAPLRRVHVNGGFTLMDYCTSPSFASGGFIADSRFDGASITSGSQQQGVVRNSTLDGWSNGVWNQVFAGVVNAPAQCYPAQPAPGCGGPYTTVPATPSSREKPYLYVDSKGAYRVFVPRAATNSTGESWASGPTPGRSLALSDFYVATPADSVATLNRQLSRGRNLLLTPGVYDVDRTIAINRADTVVLGLGLATLTAVHGAVPVSVGNVPGVDIAGLVLDAGTQNSPALMRIGTVGGRNSGRAGDPTALQDVFFRIAGPHAGRATISLQVNSDHVVLDDLWAWRADHGTGVGWTDNTAASGVVVNGDHVDAVGLFVEHYQKYQVIWNGNRGSDIFFQSEMPYDVPSQAAWKPNRATDGYAAFKVSPQVRTFTGYGMGVYSFFNQGIDIYAARAFEVPTRTGVALHDLLTIFLDSSVGRGGILEVINSTGGPSTITNPDIPVTVVDYP